jgi:outer membrane protein assembly factor BamB
MISSPDGIEYLADGTLIVTNCSTDSIVVLDAEDGTYLGQIASDGAMIDHFERNLLDNTVWGATHEMEDMPIAEMSLVQIDPETGSVLTKFELERPVPGDNPMGFPMGMGWDGEFLWTMDVENQIFYKLDPSNGEIVDQMNSPIFNACGLGFDGKCLWIGAFDTYYLIDPATGNIELTIDPPYPSYPDAIQMFTGFTWDGEYVYLDNECPYDETIYVIDFEFPTEGPCAHTINAEGGPCDIWQADRCEVDLVCDLAAGEVRGICVTLEEQPPPGSGDSGDCGCATIGASGATARSSTSLLGLLF